MVGRNVLILFEALIVLTFSRLGECSPFRVTLDLPFEIALELSDLHLACFF